MTTQIHIADTDVGDERRVPRHVRADPALRVHSTTLALAVSAVVCVLVLVLSISALLDVSTGLPTWLRAIIMATAAFTIPGIAVASLFRLPGFALNVSIAAPLSVSVLILTAQTQIVLPSWHPEAAETVIALVGLALTAFAYHMCRRRGDYGRVLELRAETWQPRIIWIAVLIAALILFIGAARRFDPATAGPTGIITHIGPLYLVSLLLVAVTIVAVYTASRFDITLAILTLVVTVIVTSMYTAIAAGTASFPTAYAHRGFVDILNRLGHLPPPSDARFSWAGFFSASAQLVRAGELPSTDAFLIWAPVVNSLVCAAPVFAIGVAITRSKRLAMMGVTISALFNWYQQDYYSPQSIASLIYFSLIAVLLWQLGRRALPDTASPALHAHASEWAHWLHANKPTGGLRSIPASIRGGLRTIPSVPALLKEIPSWLIATVRRTPGRVPGHGAVWELGVELVLAITLAALVVEHQLTPMAAIAVLLAFSVFGMTRYRMLWVLAILLFVAWFSFGARTFWYGHLHSVLGDVGQVANADSGVSRRLGTSRDYTKMQYLRLLSSGLFACFGFAGWLLLLRKDRIWIAAGFLTMIPFCLVLVQSYGGEVVIRAFVLSAPLLAPLGALVVAAVYTWASKGSVHPLRRTATSGEPARGPITRRLRVVQVAAVIGVLVVSLVLVANRGLNTAIEYTSRTQERVSQQLMNRVPTNSTVMLWWANSTLASGRLFSGVSVITVDSLKCLDTLAECTISKNPGYVVSVPQTNAALRYQYGYPLNWIDSQMQQLIDAGRYKIVYDTPEIVVLRNADNPTVELN
ncbi:hypothetical protein [Gordonia sp. 852002-51296_SCH5728562-b]|uniref:hypothetical protein n=1 Tax=Gordonia sp. 852002-51296_SCH5728562-b TaxID=1834101 RepID=UPI0007EB40C8|nr:hypothetical protein [Gordonia sp. 852002-51296_SCH5728562-b]OBA30847.1 hypothetical protein A5766_14985 [Gordonia sp. 852002-51296_SCH5728562-b]